MYGAGGGVRNGEEPDGDGVGMNGEESCPGGLNGVPPAGGTGGGGAAAGALPYGDAGGS